jgi:hypothetical protein
MHIPLWYFPLQTRLYSLQEAIYSAIVLQEAIYSAIVQESAILYIACSDRYIPCKNSSVQVVSFQGIYSKMCLAVSVSGCQLLYPAE